jgi:hypothetical protein
MNRRTRAALLAALATTAVGTASAADAATFHGTVGPGRVITLTNAQGASVSRMAAGRHTFLIHDLSSSHNYVLARGSAVVRRTGVDARGVTRWRGVSIRAGRYTVYCATHRSSMTRRFRAA